MIWLWIGFVVFVLAMLALDLGVFHRHAHVVSIREALAWTAVWVTLGLTFAVFVYFAYEGHWFGLGTQIDVADGQLNDGATAVEKYITGYIVEKSLSIDNVFVIAMIFGFFAIPIIYQHRVLFWGIIGALVMRGAMIAVGNLLISRFHWVLYVFGALLIFTGIKMLVFASNHEASSFGWIIRLTRRFFPVANEIHGEHFFVRAGVEAKGEYAESLRPGTLMLTPLALALILIESTDVIFAVDSIPAIFAITADPFLVFTSNVFAILGLRSLYFALAGMIDTFRYLKVSLAVILLIVGLKMFFTEWLKKTLGSHFNFYLLAVIIGILVAGILASMIIKRPSETHESSEEA
ncbi:TerC family protein [Schlesneria sp. T3-172]|uniref:TerC family protein n=1 Tax=Schlesneria sphaerica TaxID=3373610 RepID=UPI0037C76429